MVKSLLSIFRDSSNSFEGQGESERVILLLRQHPFVIIIRVGFTSLAFLIPIVLGINFSSYLTSQGWFNLFLFISSLWYLGIWLTIFYSLTMYTLNTFIITDRRIIDNDQHGLFNRKTSALYSHRIQDVTAHTNGIIETFLKFGNISVQTAASEKQFIFHRVPKPEEVKEVIMQTAAAGHSGIKAMVQ